MPEPPESGDWNVMRYYMIQTLKSIKDDSDRISERMQAFEVKLAVLETKAALLGGVWGLIASVIASVVVWLVTRGR